MSNAQFPLTDEQLEELVERVTERVIKLIGMGAVALLLWAAGTGHIPFK